MSYQDKLWVKFDELDIVCFCDYNNRKCPKEKRENCSLYLAKFIPLEEEETSGEKHIDVADIAKSIETKLTHETRKFQSELKRNLQKMKKFKI